MRTVVYCLVPPHLVTLHERLREHFRGQPVEVVVERRRTDRRAAADRRREGSSAAEDERRRIHNRAGRRVGERRAALVAVDSPAGLPRKARAHSGELVFVERLEPSSEALEDQDSARLVLRFQAGETAVFEAIYRRYFDRIYGYLRVALDDSHEAEDAAQQVFLKVMNALPRYERRSKPFRIWLFVVAKNHVLTQLQRRSRLDVTEPAEIERLQEEESCDSQDLAPLGWITDRELLLFIERLAPLHRQVLAMRFMLDLSPSQIAEILGRTPNDVSVIQRRALAFLRTRLVALGRGPETREGSRMRCWNPQAPVLRRRRFALLA